VFLLLVNVWSSFLFFQISDGHSDVILLMVFDVCPPRKPINLFFLSLEVIPSESDALL